jgi:hypothetical protein
MESPDMVPLYAARVGLIAGGELRLGTVVSDAPAERWPFAAASIRGFGVIVVSRVPVSGRPSGLLGS